MKEHGSGETVYVQTHTAGNLSVSFYYRGGVPSNSSQYLICINGVHSGYARRADGPDQTPLQQWCVVNGEWEMNGLIACASNAYGKLVLRPSSSVIRTDDELSVTSLKTYLHHSQKSLTFEFEQHPYTSTTEWAERNSWRIQSRIKEELVSVLLMLSMMNLDNGDPILTNMPEDWCLPNVLQHSDIEALINKRKELMQDETTKNIRDALDDYLFHKVDETVVCPDCKKQFLRKRFHLWKTRCIDCYYGNNT